ncbi:hypothetical protein KJ840_02355 [Patescibacteria group bacterium]|nr:hypothetical protein [Patescibacteria group bacterium]
MNYTKKYIKKTIFILLIIPFLLLINVDKLYACKMARPSIQISVGEDECNVYKNYSQPYREHSIDIESVNRTTIDEVCPDLKLSDEDKEIVLRFIKQYQTDLPNYIYINKQSADEYSSFLKETEVINSKICSCSQFISKDRTGDWTVYIHTYKDSCSFSTACYQPPAFCPNSVYFIPLLIYTGIGIIIIIGIILMFKLVRKRKSDKAKS